MFTLTPGSSPRGAFILSHSGLHAFVLKKYFGGNPEKSKVPNAVFRSVLLLSLTLGTPLLLLVNRSCDAARKAKSILDLPPWNGTSSTVAWNWSIVFLSKSPKSTNRFGVSLNAIRPNLVLGEVAAKRLETSFTKFFSLEKFSNPTLPEASIRNPTSIVSLQGAVIVKSFEKRQLTSERIEDQTVRESDSPADSQSVSGQ